MTTKYIILRTDIGGEAPIIFNEMISHAAVAAGREVLGAGFVSVGWDPETCLFTTRSWGKSTTLNIGNRGEEDDLILRRVFNEY